MLERLPQSVNGHRRSTAECLPEMMVAFHQGETLQRIADRFGCAQSSVRNAILRERARIIVDTWKIRYIDHAAFTKRNARKTILAPPPENPRKESPQPPPPGLPPYLASLYQVPLLTQEQERHLFLQYNFLKFLAAGALSELDRTRPDSKILNELESLRADADSTRNTIIKANLRLVVSVMKKLRPVDELEEAISDGNQTLLRAIEGFDVSRGNKFSTYATYAIQMNEWGGYGKRTRDAMRFQSNADSVFASEGVLSEKDPLAFRERRMQASGAQVAALLQSGVLNGRERAILISRFGLSEGSEPQTLKETGQKFGITKERVRQIQGKALGKLRTLVADKKMPLAADDVV